MTRYTWISLSVALLVGTMACAPAAVEPEAEAEFVTNERGLDRRNMDEAADPCDDFYQYANGQWLERNPIPPEYSVWSMSNEMRERNMLLLREILEESAAAGAEKGTNRQKVGDFWTTGMDTDKIEAEGPASIAADLERIEGMETLDDLQQVVRDLQLEGIGVLFEIAIFQDLMNSEQYLLYAIQGGIGLPDRDYYTREDEESAQLRSDYVAHISNMLQLMEIQPRRRRPRPRPFSPRRPAWPRLRSPTSSCATRPTTTTSRPWRPPTLRRPTSRGPASPSISVSATWRTSPTPSRTSSRR